MMDYNQAKDALLKICRWEGSGDEKEVKKILDYYNNTNLINEGLDSLGYTILIYASSYNNIKIIKLLLSYNNININQQNTYYGDTALHKASKIGYKETVELLLSYDKIDVNMQNDYGDTALHRASYEGYKDIVKLLLSNKNININIRNKNNDTALHNASKNETVKLLLSEDKIDVNMQNDYGDTALHRASYYGRTEIVKLLLSYKNININLRNKYGDTALHRASYEGYKDIVNLLLSEDKIDTSIQNNYGNTALHRASSQGRTEIKELIYCFKNSDINIQSMVWTDKEANKALILTALFLFFVGYLLYKLFSKLFKNHNKKAKDSLPLATTSATDCDEGSLLTDNDMNEPTEATFHESKESDESGVRPVHNLEDLMKDRELLTVVEEKESFKLQIDGVEEKLREMTNNNMKEMERHLQEKENYMKEMDYMKNNRNEMVKILHDNNKSMVDNLMNEMKKHFINMERTFEEKEKDLLVKMESRFEALTKHMEHMESSQKEFEKRFEEKKKLLVVKPLPLPPNKQTHVFLTHTWMEDEEGRNNHDRVGRVNEALKKRGLVTWFDSERMSGIVREAMTDALDATCCVLIFITKKYEVKVNSKNEADNCYFEFNVAAHDNYLANMRIPIVMEECMLNEKGWQGRLKTEMAHQLYFDLSSDDKDVFEERCNEVFVRVVKLLNI